MSKRTTRLIVCISLAFFQMAAIGLPSILSVCSATTLEEFLIGEGADLGIDVTEDNITSYYCGEEDEPDNESNSLQSAQSAPLFTTQINGVDVKLSLVYDNAYSEQILIPGKNLTTLVGVTNNASEDKILNLVFNLYDENKRMLSVNFFTHTIVAGATDNFKETIPITTDETVDMAKILIWSDMGTIMPYTSPVILTLNSEDYFGDDVSLSQPLNMYSDASGKINSANDIDVFAYTPSKSGLYVFETYGETDTIAELKYGTSIIASDNNSGEGNNFRLSATLTEGETYHLYVHGNTLGEYDLKAFYAIGNLYGSVSPVVFDTTAPDFNEEIEGKVTLKTFDTNDFVATMHLREWSLSTSDHASFDITGIHGGTYLVSFTRPGYLTRYRKILLSDNALDLGSVTLLAGDVDGNGVINTADSTLLQSRYNKQYGQAGYDVASDLNGDKTINALDLALLTPNLNKNANTYGETSVNVISVAAVSGSTLNISGTAAANSAVTITVFKGSTDVYTTTVTANSSGEFTASCELSKAGTYDVIATAANRVFDATDSVNY